MSRRQMLVAVRDKGNWRDCHINMDQRDLEIPSRLRSMLCLLSLAGSVHVNLPQFTMFSNLPNNSKLCRSRFRLCHTPRTCCLGSGQKVPSWGVPTSLSFYQKTYAGYTSENGKATNVPTAGLTICSAVTLRGWSA